MNKETHSPKPAVIAQALLSCYSNSMNTVKRKMPIGSQSFKGLREGGFIYVDKTEFIWKLVTSSRINFLSRPRRFGKSLFLSTLAAYFLGQKELFTGLKIAEWEAQQEHPWQIYPVLYVDFNPSKYETREDLEGLLHNQLCIWEDLYGKRESETLPSERFKGIIQRAYEKTGKQVVILVDEYDKPLLETMSDNPALHDTYRTILKGFYGVLKSCDAAIRFAFLTGVTKFSKVSIFSDLNNLYDISLEKQYAELCGITQTELEATFMPEIQALAENYETDSAEILRRLKENYDGYLFHHKGMHVYNPWSLLHCFASCEFGSYWFATGTPTFLIDLLKAGTYDIRDITEHAEMSRDSLSDYRPNAENPTPVFFQAGYLTIKSYDEEFAIYTLAFPNKEVKQGFFHNLTPAFMALTKNESGLYTRDFVLDIEKGDITTFMKRMYTACAGIPYSTAAKAHHAMRERDYQIAFYIIFTLMGYHVDLESHTAKGRADLVVRTADCVYIFEFKLMSAATAEEALNQIKEKGYADKYRMSGKKIIGIGAVFGDGITNETPDTWKMEELS